MPKYNLEKLVMTRALVKEERRAGRWDQGHWTEGLGEPDADGFMPVVCGTTACVAGWAVIADGGKFLSDDAVLANDLDTHTYNFYRGYQMPTVRATSVELRAQRLLGLDGEEMHELFDGDNEYRDVKRLLKKYIKEARKERRKLAKRARKSVNF